MYTTLETAPRDFQNRFISKVRVYQPIRMLYKIIYCSTATHPFSAEALGRLVVQASAHNDSEGITGVLCYANQQFFQVLEGEQTAVEALYARISRDSRHSDSILLFRAPVAQRLFISWGLGFSYVDTLVLQRLIRYLDPRTQATLIPGDYDAQAIFRDLLSEFVAEQFRPALLPAGRVWGRKVLLNNGLSRRSHPRLPGNRLAAHYGSLR